MVFELLALSSIPILIATVQGTRHHRELEKSRQDDDQSRLQDFHLDVYCSSTSRKRDHVDKTMIVLRNGKLHLAPKNTKTGQPIPIKGSSKADHPFTGFYLNFEPDIPQNHSFFERLNKPQPFRGLVSTISTARTPPLNWIFVDKNTFEVKYGPRSEVDGHILGPWNWTEDEVGLTIEGWEGFVAVEEEKDFWGLYFDRGDDGLKARVAKGTRVLQCSLERRVIDLRDVVE